MFKNYVLSLTEIKFLKCVIFLKKQNLNDNFY